MQKPLVTAIIPTRNRCETLRRALESVYAQNWEAMEVVVVDDASTDDTPALLKEYSEKKGLRYYRNDQAKGAAVSRNVAIGHATGEYIAGLDDDDLWHPQRIEMLMNALEPGVAGVTSYDLFIRNGKKRLWKKPGLNTHHDLLLYNRVGNQILTKKEYLTAVGGFDESLPSAQDYDLWIRLTVEFGPIKVVKEPLQTIFEEGERISSASGAAAGYEACYRKHEGKMDERQKRYQQYRIKLAAGNKPGLIEFIKAVPPQMFVKELARLSGL
jgi:glycosyltransferase involved in cell wall biosynthesis